MKRLFAISLVLFALLFLTGAQFPVGFWKAAAAAPPPSYSFIETFDAAGYDNAATWDDSSAPGINADYAPALEGTQSCSIASGFLTAGKTYTSWFFEVKASSFVDYENLFTLKDSGYTALVNCSTESGHFSIYSGSAGGDGTVITPTTGVKYYMWVDYNPGVSVDFYISTTTTKTGGDHLHYTTGVATTAPVNVYFNHGALAAVYDRVIGNNTPIGDNP